MGDHRRAGRLSPELDQPEVRETEYPHNCHGADVPCSALKDRLLQPDHPYLVIIPTILLSAGMLFFFTLGSSMVGDICDEDELKTGHRSEGSYYSIFWWFIKLGTAFASFVAGILITLTLFDQTQVTKVDSLQGSMREMQSKIQYWNGYDGTGCSCGMGSGMPVSDSGSPEGIKRLPALS